MKRKKGFRAVSLSLAVLWAFLVWTMASAFAADGVDWKNHTITVTGMGIAPPDAVNQAHARIMARRAAVVDGYRQMAELIKGVHVDAESTVENMILRDDVIKTKVSACVQGARVIGERATLDGGYEVTMEVPLFGVSNSLAAAVLPKPAVKEPFPAPTPENPASSSTSSTSSTTTVVATVRVDTARSVAGRTPAAAPAHVSLVSGRELGTVPCYDPVQPPYPQTPYPYFPYYPYYPNYPYYPYYEPAPSRPSGDSADSGTVPPSPSGTPAANPPSQEVPSTQAAYQASGDYTSLVVDCTGLDLQPAMSPVIKNENGEAIYGASNLDYDVVTAKGMAAYSRSLDVSDISRAGEKPLVVKGVSVEGHNINPVITVADANHVLLENEQSHFLSDLNVIFVR